MESKDFIKQTLIDITTGVSEAQEAIKDSGAYINPKGFTGGEALSIGFNDNSRNVQKIKMSVGVNAVENSEMKGGIGVITVFSAGLSGKISDVNSVTNRIEFEIPISLPIMNIKK